MDIQALAEVTAQFLAPLLPFLIQGAKDMAKAAFERTGEKLTDEGWEKGKELWEKLKPKIDKEQDAIKRAEKKPEDKRVIQNLQTSLELQLEEVFNEDASLAQTIHEIHDSIVIDGDVKNANILNKSNHNQFAEKIINLYYNTSQSVVEKEKIKKSFDLYLEKLRRQCNALPLAALGGDETDEEITLDKIYIELDTTSFKEGSEKKSGRKVKIDDNEVALNDDEKMPISVLDAAIENKLLVLLGEAGAGKSTFVKKLLALQAAVLLGETKDALSGFDAELIPVLIVLRDISPKLADLNLGTVSAENQKQKLADLILEKIQEDVKTNKASDSLPVLEEAFEKGKLLLALDGLDEVPQNMRKLVRQAVGALIQLNKIERIIITSRSRSYVGEAIFSNFESFTIAPFDRKKIKQFSFAWYNERHQLGHITEAQIKERADDLAGKSSDRDLIEISSNPMMLTSIAILHQRDIGLPNERVKLYKLLVDVLIKRWQKHKTGEDNFALSPELTAFLKNDDKLQTTLKVLAYKAHRANYDLEKNSDKKSKKESDLARGEVLTLLEQKDYLGNQALAGEFLDYVDQRSGILVGKGGELEKPTSYSFPHRTIQEYLAGCYLVSGRTRGREFLKHAAEGDFWSLAALMGAEAIFYNSNDTRDILLDLIYELCSENSLENEQKQRALLWSAQIASIFDKKEIEDDEKPNGGKNYLRQLIALTKQLIENNYLTPRERAEAADSLDRLGYVSEDLYDFVEIRSNDLSRYYLSKYLITNAQYERFLQPENFTNKDLWINFPKYDENSKPMKEAWGDAPWKWLQKELKDKDNDVEDNVLYPRYWRDPRFGINRRHAPVVGISWYEANAYCNWLIQQKDLPEWRHLQTLNLQPATFRLPTEMEWEQAAGGEENNRFAFGELKNIKEEIINYANTRESNINRTTPVWMYPQGASKPYGLMDMSGNVWEWQANYRDTKQDWLGLRGGSWNDIVVLARVAFRNSNLPHLGDDLIGFRVCASPLPKSS